MTKISNLLMAVCLFAAVFMISSCRKDIEEVPLVNLLGEAKNLTVKGRVVDEAGNPVAGATVQAGYGSQSTTTDQYGVFMLQAIKGYQKLGYIKVTKSGYLPGSRSFAPVKSGSNIIEIMLLQKNVVGTVSATAGGTVMAEGAKITFPANGFVKNGKAYTGNVKVAANLIDPTSPTLMQEMPGSLVGAMENQAYALQSFGMIGVELTDDNGNKIDLAPDAKATINFPLPSSILNDAPGTIQLWSFDELSGIWKHEGNAQKVNGQYVAEVGHFSYWNCDVPFNFVQVDGVLKDSQGSILSCINVEGKSTMAFGFSLCTTNEFGQFSMQLPNLGAITLFAKNNYSYLCNNNPNIGLMNLGWLSSNINVDFVVPASPNQNLIIGKLIDCNNNPVPYGYINVNGTVVYSDMNGDFNTSTCVNIGASATIFGCNLITNQYSDLLSLIITSGTNNMGNIQVCSLMDTSGVSDIEGNYYPAVYIGNIKWTSSNLRVTKFNDGTPISLVMDSVQWINTTQPAYYYYDNSIQNQNKYGNLYNHRTITHTKNVCPVGWHVPTSQEYYITIGFLGDSAGTSMKANIPLWEFSSFQIVNTNSSGFSALPAGTRSHTTGSFGFEGLAAYFGVKSGIGHFGFTFDSNIPFASQNEPNFGISIRCVKD